MASDPILKNSKFFPVFQDSRFTTLLYFPHSKELVQDAFIGFLKVSGTLRMSFIYIYVHKKLRNVKKFNDYNFFYVIINKIITLL